MLSSISQKDNEIATNKWKKTGKGKNELNKECINDKNPNQKYIQNVKLLNTLDNG